MKQTALILGILTICQSLHSAVTFTFDQIGSDVVATTSGSIASGWTKNFNVVSATSQGGVLSYDGIRGTTDDGIWYMSTGGHWSYNEFGRSSIVSARTGGVTTGDTFGFSGSSNFFVPAGTNIGDAITPNTTITWANESFTSLGLDTGLSTTPIVVFTLDNGDTINAVRTDIAIPEPSTYAAVIGVLCIGFFITRRHRR